ncbi:uncharacterized protein LOC116393688 [Anarrhichthys ocellatus]|uniref:uncharacterized protein LOC116393688 n=1 Tax=Anarrhichthys ocellatus TaxID=433405 RepID=UPI0012ED285C|nr:uncharacterized protein LOC116393688 [Anarrhichthys ocellatus]
MADTSLGVSCAVNTILQSAAAGFAFGEAALFAVEPSLTADDDLLTAATQNAGRVGSTGVGAVTACLAFTSALVSLGSGFLLAAVMAKLLTRVGLKSPWLVETTTGACVVAGAVTTGVSAGLLPLYIYISAQGFLVLLIYSYSNINDMITALTVIFTTLYVCVVYGRMGVMVGLFVMGLTISVLCALRKALTERMTLRSNSKTECQLLQRLNFYSVFVAILGFFAGLGAGEAGEGSKAEVVLVLQSVVWVVFLSAGLLGASLGTVATVGLEPGGVGKVALGAAIMSSLSLRAILQSSSFLGTRSSMGATLGAVTAAGVSIGAASVAAKKAFETRKSTLTAVGSVVVGAVLAMRGVALTGTLPTTSELLTITLIAAWSFFLGAPKSPFNTLVNLRMGLLTGPQLMKGIGMETVTAAAAPFGAGALGAAALATASLGKMGTVGILVAVFLAVGSVLSGVIGSSLPTIDEHSD